MNIMILVASFPPIIDSAARLYFELAENFRDMGHNVTVITIQPSETDVLAEGHEYHGNESSSEVLDGIKVLRVSHLSFLAKYPGGKALRYLLSPLLFALRAFSTTSPDVILVYSPPLYLGISGYIISKIRRSKFVFNMQDIHPKVLFDLGIIKNNILKKMLIMLEEISYHKAYSFIVYSAGNRDYLLQRGVKREVHIIPNWVDMTTMIKSDGTQSFRNEEVIGDKFVVSYAGTMQEAQGLEAIVEAAEALKEYDDIIFLLVGEGPSKPILKSLISQKNLNNVLLRPVMPQDHYVQFLLSSDVSLLPLSPDAPPQTVPGKLAMLMASGKPIIATINLQGDAAGVIKEAGCGICVYPGDVAGFMHAVLKLYQDKRLRKEMGEKAKTFAEQHFSRTVCTKQYEQVLLSAMRANRE